MTTRPIRRALVSVYDKTGLEELARALHAADVEIVSTGSTAATIEKLGVPVTAVSDLTGFAECLDGRVKTLHPLVHAGILADLRLEEHRQQLDQLGIAPFELVVVNLYPFAATVTSGASFDECVEQIDIGGPTMVRAAAKNHPSVAVITSPDQYADVAAALQSGGFDLDARKRLAAAAFAHTAAYDVAVANWLGWQVTDSWPQFTGATYRLSDVLRYGENPHQPAAIYVEDAAPPGLAQAEQLHGKQMSYNNYVDTDAARRAAYDFAEPCVAIIKHANPCGIAVGPDVATAHRRAHECDPASAFGGVIAVNRPVSVELAKQVSEIFTEVIVAPAYDEGAIDILTGKPSIRILVAGDLPPDGRMEAKQITGGLLLQAADAFGDADATATWTLQAGEPADAATLADLEFAWRACRSVKSNAILLADDGATVGVGMGQVNRVDAAKLAVARAGARAAGAVAASDAFFPFADGLEVLTAAGVRAVVEPGGSVRDAEVVQAANTAGITLYFTGVRHFFH
ncbi:MAG: bifunctional phosphoribosylaminoimidazolecarboxamide formyltransferase/IMP cyclohydrolase [Mycobacteriales bacterium]